MFKPFAWLAFAASIFITSVLLTDALATRALASPIPDENSGPAAGPAPPVRRVVTNPDWVRKPNADDLTRFYPKAAQYLNLAGRAIIHCQIDVKGQLHDCNLIAETPRGVGFGDAALDMASVFQMRPKTVDGSPVAGAEVSVPIRFTPTPADDPPPPDQPDVSVDPATAAAAVKLATLVTTGTARWIVDRPASLDLQNIAARNGATPEIKLALAAEKEAQLAAIDRMIHVYARAYASKLSLAELTELNRLFAAPAAQHWLAADVSEAVDPTVNSLDEFISRTAHDRFCAKIACL